MEKSDLLLQIAPGEDSTHQFKVDIRNGQSLASKMAAFANSGGGTIYIGVSDDGSIQGLSKEDVSRINQIISNTASQLVRSPLTVHTENIVLKNERIVIVLTVPKGIDKPYFDKNRIIWLKTGSDKRRDNSKEELVVNALVGLGSGIKRALSLWPDIDFFDDRDGCLFTVTIHRKANKSSVKSSVKTDEQIMEMLFQNSFMTIPELAEALGLTTRGVEKQIAKLKKQDRLRRIGSNKGGHWEVLKS